MSAVERSAKTPRKSATVGIEPTIGVLQTLRPDFTLTISTTQTLVPTKTQLVSYGSSGFPEDQVEHLDPCCAAIRIRVFEPRDQVSTHVTVEVVGEDPPDAIMKFNNLSQPCLNWTGAREPKAEVLQYHGVNHRHVRID